MLLMLLGQALAMLKRPRQQARAMPQTALTTTTTPNLGLKEKSKNLEADAFQSFTPPFP